METLTERVLRFQRTGEGREAIVRDVACRIYEYPRQRCRWDEESASEFFARIYPKISGMIERFRDVGRPFESYLASTLMFQVRTFAQDKKRRELEWHLAADPTLWDREAVPVEGREASGRLADGGAPGADSPSASRPACAPGGMDWANLDPAIRDLFDVDPRGRIGSPAARRRFLVVWLKSAHLWSDADVTAAAGMVGCPEEWLHGAVEKLRARQLRASRRVGLFTERRNRAFSGLRLTDAQLSREVEPERRRELEARRGRLKATMASCQRIISRIRLGPSHKDIAEILSMPKATVDSTIHRLKSKAAALYASGHEEYA